MAKGNRMASLISGIRGENLPQGEPTTQEKETDTAAVPQSIAEELGLSKEQEETLNAIRRRNIGRPVGAKSGTAKPREERATFIVDKELTRKLKYIALADTKLYKKVIAEALSSYIEKWENENGVITLPNNK